MARVFLSHSTTDKKQALQLMAWLREHGHTEIFLDSDKDTGIPAGADWERTLYREMERSQAVIILLTKHWMESKWCFAEFTQARAQGKAIFPIVETPAGELMVGRDLQSIDLTHGREGGLERLSRALARIAHASPEGFTLPEGISPFPGLDALTEQQAAVFFGRDDDVAGLIERLRKARTHGGGRVIPIVGASGSGKSSLLLAGVVPRIRLDVANWLVLDPFRPASKPVDRFITVLLAAAHHAAAEHGPSSGEALPLGAWRRALSSPEPAAALAEIAESIRRHLGRLDTGILIAIDQAEELFTLAGDAERDGFLKLLADALGNGLPYFAVATLRSEYLSDLQAARSLSVALEPYTLAPLPLERLSALVRGPARLAGLGVEDALVDALISDAGSTDALPLVAFTLRRLYEAERGSGRLTLARYRALGDEARGLNPLENAVRQTAEEALPRDGRSDEADDALKRAFIAGLVRATPDGKLVRRSAPVAMFAPAVREDIDHLVHARLLVLRTEDLDGVEQEVVEVAHESLFRVWDRLAKWIGEEGDFLVGKSRITQAREDWKALAPAKRELNKGLLGDILLERASAWLAERPKAFSAEERAFIGASIKHEADQRARVTRLRRLLTGATAGAFLVFAVAGWLWLEANAAKRRSSASLDVARSKTALQDGDVDTAVRAAMSALGVDDRVDTRSAALTAVLELSPYLAAMDDLPERGGMSIAWSDASTLAVLTRDSIQRVEATNPAARHGQEIPVGLPGSASGGHHPAAAFLSYGSGGIGTLIFEDGSIAAVGDGAPRLLFPAPKIEGALALTPGSLDMAEQVNRIAIRVGYDGVLVRDCTGRAPENTFECADRFHPVDAPVALAIDPTGQRIAIANAGGWVTVRALTAGFDVVGERDIGAAVSALDWSRMGNRLAVGTQEGHLLVLDPASGDLTPLERGRPTDLIPRVRWSPDGTRLAFVCDRNDICLHALGAGTTPSSGMDDLIRLSGHRGTVTDLAWAPDGQRLASIGLDDRLRVWSIAPDRSVRFALQTGTRRRLSRLAVDSRTDRIAAGDARGGVWVWTPGEGPRLLPAPDPISTPVTDLAWNAQGHLVCVYESQAVGYWTADGKEPLRLDPIPGSAFSRVAVLGDGRYAVPLSDGRIALLSASGAPPTYLGHPEDFVEPWGIAVHPDGHRLFVSYTDGSIHRWNLSKDGDHGDLVSAETAGPGADGAGSLALSADGTLIAATRNDDVVVVYDVDTGKARHRLALHASVTKTVAFSTSGRRLAVLGADGRIDIWDLDSPSEARFFAVPGVPDRSATGRAAGAGSRAAWLQWLANDRIAVATGVGEIQVYDLGPGAWKTRVNGLYGPRDERDEESAGGGRG